MLRKGLPSEFLGFLSQSGLSWEDPARPTEGSTLRKEGQGMCQGSLSQLQEQSGLLSQADRGKQSNIEMAGGPASKPRSKELSRLSSEPGMKGGHPQGVRGPQGGQRLGPRLSTLAQISGEACTPMCARGRKPGLIPHCPPAQGEPGLPPPPGKLVNTCYAGLERSKLRV